MHVHVRALAPTILPLSTCLHPVTSCKSCRCAFDQRSVGHLRERSVVRLITPKVLKEARRCELVLRDSFPFRWSASEVQAKWPVSADTHRPRRMLKLPVARCIVTCTCTCVRLLPPFFHCPLFASGHVMQGMQVCLRSKISWASEREISCEIDHTESSERSETVRVGSERFFSFRWSASEVQAKWPVSADAHRHRCWTESKSFENQQLVWTGMWNFQWRSNGERQTNRARIKAPWTH